MKKEENTQRKDELQTLRDWFSYNTFVRKRYLGFLARFPRNAINKDRGASYPSILDIFTHVLDVYKSWFNLYEKGENLPELKGLSLEEVKKLERDVDEYLHNFMQNVTLADLNRAFQYSYGKGKNRKIIKRVLVDMLWHLVEEELQHRGEMNALLWQDDIDPPVTSWFRWKRSLK